MRHRISNFSLRIRNKASAGVFSGCKLVLIAHLPLTCHALCFPESSRSLVLDMRIGLFMCSDCILKCMRQLALPVFSRIRDYQSFSLEIFDRKQMLVSLNGRSPPEQYWCMESVSVFQG